jgi:hypothetical protein
MARTQKKPLGAVFAIVKVLVFLAIIFFRAPNNSRKKIKKWFLGCSNTQLSLSYASLLACGCGLCG